MKNAFDTAKDNFINWGIWNKPAEFFDNSDIDEKMMAYGGAFIYGFTFRRPGMFGCIKKYDEWYYYSVDEKKL